MSSRVTVIVEPLKVAPALGNIVALLASLPP